MPICPRVDKQGPAASVLPLFEVTQVLSRLKSFEFEDWQTMVFPSSPGGFQCQTRIPIIKNEGVSGMHPFPSPA